MIKNSHHRQHQHLWENRIRKKNKIIRSYHYDVKCQKKKCLDASAIRLSFKSTTTTTLIFFLDLQKKNLLKIFLHQMDHHHFFSIESNIHKENIEMNHHHHHHHWDL